MIRNNSEALTQDKRTEHYKQAGLQQALQLVLLKPTPLSLDASLSTCYMFSRFD